MSPNEQPVPPKKEEGEDEYAWLTPDFYADAYREFIHLRFDYDPFPDIDNPIVDPDSFTKILSNSNLTQTNAEDVKAHQDQTKSIEHFLNSLCNELNSLMGWLFDLSAWQKTLEPFSGSKRYHLLQQFVCPLSVLTLSFPYAFKSQLEYAACKIAGMLSGDAAAIQPKENRDYRSKHFRLAMEHIDGSDRLVGLVNKINSKSFEKNTKEFRQHNVHRVPIQIEFGLAFDVQVTRKGDMISITDSQIDPISIETVIKQGKEQHRACREALMQLKTLITDRL